MDIPGVRMGCQGARIIELMYVVFLNRMGELGYESMGN